MPDLTDEELGTLLRETFADREALVGRAEHHVPTATKPRRVMPVLLAAATVLVVLGGVLYGVQRLQPGTTQSTTTTTAPAPVAGPALATVQAAGADHSTRDADVWGLAIGVMLRSFQLPGKPTGFSPFTRAIVVDSPSI